MATKRVLMRTRYAGPEGTHQPNEVVTFEAKTAAALVDGGYAQYVSPEGAVKAPAPQIPGDLQAAAKTLAGRWNADRLADMAEDYEIQFEANDTKATLALKIVTARQALGEDLLEGAPASENEEEPEPNAPRARALADE